MDLGVQVMLKAPFEVESKPCLKQALQKTLSRQSMQPYAGDVLDGQLESRTPGLAHGPVISSVFGSVLLPRQRGLARHHAAAEVAVT